MDSTKIQSILSLSSKDNLKPSCTLYEHDQDPRSIKKIEDKGFSRNMYFSNHENNNLNSTEQMIKEQQFPDGFYKSPTSPILNGTKSHALTIIDNDAQQFIPLTSNNSTNSNNSGTNTYDSGSIQSRSPDEKRDIQKMMQTNDPNIDKISKESRQSCRNISPYELGSNLIQRSILEKRLNESNSHDPRRIQDANYISETKEGHKDLNKTYLSQFKQVTSDKYAVPLSIGKAYKNEFYHRNYCSSDASSIRRRRFGEQENDLPNGRYERFSVSWTFCFFPLITITIKCFFFRNLQASIFLLLSKNTSLSSWFFVIFIG